MPRAALPALQLSLQFADARHRQALPRHRVARWIRASLQAPAQITVRLVDAEEGRALNRDYRGKDYATNVLTFAYGASGEEGGERDDEVIGDDRAPPGDAPQAELPLFMADLVLCAPVIEAEARAAGKPLAAHYAHLLVHGALHAQGWDHEDEKQAQAMEARETAILTALGMADPYTSGPAQAPAPVLSPARSAASSRTVRARRTARASR